MAMNFLLFVVLLGVARGAPQYNYPKPSGGAISPGGISGRPSSGKPSNGYLSGPVAGAVHFPLNGQVGGQYNGQGQNGIQNGGVRGRPTNAKSQVGLSNGQTNGQVRGQANGQIGGQANGQGPQYNIPNEGFGFEQPAVIQKNVYVHIPPPELEEGPQPISPVQFGAPEKNYKIIFIKAPTPPQSQAPIIPLPPRKEEKTLVYVLVKKPEALVQPIIPTPEPTQPSKPEVFFIRYKPIGAEGEYVQTPQFNQPEGNQGPEYQLGQPGNQGPSINVGDTQIYSSQQSAGGNYLPPEQQKPVQGGAY